MKDSVFFEMAAGSIHALRIGQGKELLLAFHGFSDSAQMFGNLRKALPDSYTLLALDLPFHGQTEWRKPDFSKSDLLEVVAQILEKENKSRFCLLGFSFGARLAQAMLPQLATQLDELILLSPDGIKTRGLNLAEQTPMWLRRLLFRLLQRPAWFLALADWGQNAGLVSKFTHQFLRKNLSRPERVQRTLGCWLAMESFRISPAKLRQVFCETSLKTRVYVGAEDPLLDLQALRKVYGGLENVYLTVLEGKGHRLRGNWPMAMQK